MSYIQPFAAKPDGIDYLDLKYLRTNSVQSNGNQWIISTKV